MKEKRIGKQAVTIRCPTCGNGERVDIQFDNLPFSTYDWFPQCSKCKVTIHFQCIIRAIPEKNNV